MNSARAIVAGHGSFAEGILSAVEQITGRSDLFLGLSNRDLSAHDVECVMRERVDALGVLVVFTDLPAGSCTMAARRIQRDHPGLTVVTGVNLAALLHFVFSDAADAESIRRVAEKGREALVVTEAPRGA